MPHQAVMLFIPLRFKPEPLLLFRGLHSEIHRKQHSQRIILIIQYVVTLYLKKHFILLIYLFINFFIRTSELRVIFMLNRDSVWLESEFAHYYPFSKFALHSHWIL